ncbi:MAG: hypothetical protein ACKVOU_04625 [Cytophagales bacterium]
MEVLVAEFQCSKVYYIEPFKLGKIVWNGAPDHHEFRKPFKALLNFAEKNPVENFLSDVRQQGVVSDESRIWFENQALPEAREAGLKRGAIVTNDNVFKMKYTSFILLVTNRFQIPVKLFPNQFKAEKWLIENLLLEISTKEDSNKLVI